MLSVSVSCLLLWNRCVQFPFYDISIMLFFPQLYRLEDYEECYDLYKDLLKNTEVSLFCFLNCWFNMFCNPARLCLEQVLLCLLFEYLQHAGVGWGFRAYKSDRDKDLGRSLRDFKASVQEKKMTTLLNVSGEMSEKCFFPTRMTLIQSVKQMWLQWWLLCRCGASKTW